MKRICITLISVLAACSLAGCTSIEGTPLNSGAAENAALAANEAADIIKDETSVEDKAEDKITTEIPILKVRHKEWDEDMINENFIAPRNDLTHKEYPSDLLVDDTYDVYIGEEGEGKDAYWLVYENGRLTVETRRDFIKYGYGTLAAGLGSFSFGEYYDAEEIALFPKEDAVRRGNALMDTIGIKNYSEPEVYAITADKANAILDGEWKDKQNNPHYYEKWTEENEIYILTYSLEYNGIPVTDVCCRSVGGLFVGSSVEMIVTKDEIISLDAYSIFSDEYEVGESVEVNCTEEKAIEMAMKYYDDGRFETIKILDCEIVYMPIDEYDFEERIVTLVPMWKVDVSARSANDDGLTNYSDCVFINVTNSAPYTGGRIVF